MFLYTNRAKTQLARNMSVNDTTLTLMSGTGDLFPALSENNDSFPVTLASANNPDNYEIVYCMARNGDVLTVKRGQEGLSPKNFMSGDIVSLNMTASTYRRMPQAGYLGTFQTEIANSPGGYHRGALVNDDSTPTLYWINLQDGNSTHPEANNTTWQALDVSSVVHAPDIEGFVSGTLDLSSDDKQGIGLHTRGSDQAVLYKDSANGWRALALQDGLAAEEKRAKAAEEGLQPKGNYVPTLSDDKQFSLTNISAERATGVVWAKDEIGNYHRLQPQGQYVTTSPDQYQTAVDILNVETATGTPWVQPVGGAPIRLQPQGQYVTTSPN